MLSDEENEVLEILKSFEPDDLVECAIYLKALEKIKNLIEKQQKEIEEIKKHRQILNNVEFGKFPYDKNYQVKIEAGRQQGKSFRAGMEFSNKIWEDKIKAKIEELDYNDIANFERRCKQEVLQSLLEKE